MCGRYTFFTDRELEEIDKIVEQVSREAEKVNLKTGEIFPTDTVPVLLAENHVIAPKLIQWGFPSWTGKGVIINGRSESVREKKMFSESFQNRRCVIPSTGFYEWNKEKQKYLFRAIGQEVLYMAGIYDFFYQKPRFVILTTQSEGEMKKIHDRMPVVLLKEQIETWICDEKGTDAILFGNRWSLQGEVV